MSESRNDFGRKIGKVRSKKLNSRVDLTAMVGVSFLLIAFFMLNNELSRPQTMSLTLPDHTGCRGYGGCGENRSLTILLGDNDKAVLYMGMLEYPMISPKTVEYGKRGIRKELLKIDKQVHDYNIRRGRTKSGLVVIIKPSKKSNYSNLIDILDEMSIVGVNTYAIVNEFTPEEAKLVAR